MAQQTTVEWLAFQLMDNWSEIHNGNKLIDEFIEQAKAMEKEQIMDAFVYGDYNGFCRYKSIGSDDISSEEYYNKTYKK